MKLTPTPRRGRPSFTLIELLVVIAIIAVLASLTTAAVMKFLLEAPCAETCAELVNLTAALEKFKKDFDFYPPSRIMLKEAGNWNLNAPSWKRIPSRL